MQQIECPHFWWCIFLDLRVKGLVRIETFQRVDRLSYLLSVFWRQDGQTCKHTGVNIEPTWLSFHFPIALKRAIDSYILAYPIAFCKLEAEPPTKVPRLSLGTRTIYNMGSLPTSNMSLSYHFQCFCFQSGSYIKPIQF